MKTGTMISKVTKPVAKTLDDLFGTDWQNCAGCNNMIFRLDNAETLWDYVDAVKERFSSQQKEIDSGSIS